MDNLYAGVDMVTEDSRRWDPGRCSLTLACMCDWSQLLKISTAINIFSHDIDLVHIILTAIIKLELLKFCFSNQAITVCLNDMVKSKICPDSMLIFLVSIQNKQRIPTLRFGYFFKRHTNASTMLV